LDLLFGHQGLFGTLSPEYIDRHHILHLLYKYDSPLQLQIWFWISVVLCLFTILGIFTKVSLILTYFSLMLFQERDPWMLFGADKLMKQAGVWLLFLNYSSVFSLSRFFFKKTGKTKRSEPIPLWPVKAFQIQVALVYFASFIAKASTDLWQDGSALFYAIQLRDCGHNFVPWILEQKLLLTFMNYMALTFEGLFLFLIFWKPTRWIALLSGVAFHLGIDLLMHIRFFSLTMIWSYIAFLYPTEIKRVLYCVRSYVILAKSRIIDGTAKIF
jgi:hypothetical protein